MVVCTSCGKSISTRGGVDGVRERDQAYHIECAPSDLLGDALSEWNAIYNRGVKYFVKKYSAQGGTGRGDRQGHVNLFAEMGKALAAESKKRKKR